MALQGTSSPINVRALAVSQDIPLRFLEVILNELKQGDFVFSIRGKHGGYRLARPADQITISQIIRFLETSFETPPPAAGQSHPGQSIFNRLLEKVNQQISTLCDEMTLEKMVTEYKSQQPFIPNYVI